ncbi:MAG: ADP-ribosylation factor-like protein [Promethearchaeota archaeon]
MEKKTKPIKITLSLWDIGGQKRFEFFKTDFYNGCAAVGLVFDLARPDTFDKVDDYFKEIRERSGNIPILLVGNKNDVIEEIGETIPREKIIQKVNQYNLFEYIETSALKNKNVEKLFNRLSITALLDFRPRLGEIIDNNHFRFKILLVGLAGVGKSSLIRAFVKKDFKQDYKLTIGLDLMTQDYEIPDDDLPEEVKKRINAATSKTRVKFKRQYGKEKISSVNTSSQKTTKIRAQGKNISEHDNFLKKNKSKKKILFKKNRIYTISIIIIIILFVVILTSIFI